MQAALQRPFSSALGLPRPARGCTRCQVECKSSGRTAGHKRRPQALVTTGADVTILTRTSQTDRNAALPDQHCDRRQAVAVLVGLGAGIDQFSQPAAAFPGFKKELGRNKRSVPESEYKSGPEGLRYYDLVKGTGDTAREGQRVAVHFEAKWRGVTFMTSRQGMGVTGGTPLGFDIGADSRGGSTLKGLDLGVRGMKVNGQRKLLVPPELPAGERDKVVFPAGAAVASALKKASTAWLHLLFLAYGERGYGGEIPPNATLEIDVQLLSIKKDSRGYQTKLIEGSFWLTTVGASAAVQYARPIPTSLKVIHTRVYAQAFTLAALAAAGIVEYYDHRMQTSEDLLSYSDRVRILEERLHLISPRPGTEVGSGPTAEDKAKK